MLDKVLFISHRQKVSEPEKKIIYTKRDVIVHNILCNISYYEIEQILKLLKLIVFYTPGISFMNILLRRINTKINPDNFDWKCDSILGHLLELVFLKLFKFK